MDQYQLELQQSGQYLKIVDGVSLGEATPGEVRCYNLLKKYPGVEAGILEVALALAGVTGLLSTLSDLPVIQLFSGVAFLFSLLGAYNLTWLYTQPRLPITWTHFLTSSIKKRYPGFPLTFWLPFYFVRKAIQLSISSKDAEDQLLEISYLVLFLAVILAGLALAIHVFLELYVTFSAG